MEVICLANSYKHHGRCFAGIAPQHPRWIRPICRQGGTIPAEDQLIDVTNIKILDVVDLPLESEQAEGHEEENFYYRREPWRIVRRSTVAEIIRYCDKQVFYPQFEKSIPYDYLEQRAPVKSLQIIEVKHLQCLRDHKHKWRGIIQDSHYRLQGTKLSITDPITLEKLESQQSISPHCLLTLSFSQPWHPDGEKELKCYRLIAGVIELWPELELILMEMRRLGWTEERGRSYLQENFGKRSRYELTIEECQRFLFYLQNLL
ncbi:dual OB domain-containing protein [Synechocystis sp. CACIAM 05]|uniref:dual OB domain-containing protein n=1 Tax=Synechocystis sp. CACIAM 05 TaxID=1933929 RepID=UPI00138E6027|nr:hypothetical protein [Synechocystis sp. CACIAM 05]QHV00776.1 hypothetical protein BWK47_12015 [Synechocystis sp. CACIAM 05]